MKFENKIKKIYEEESNWIDLRFIMQDLAKFKIGISFQIIFIWLGMGCLTLTLLYSFWRVNFLGILAIASLIIFMIVYKKLTKLHKSLGRDN